MATTADLKAGTTLSGARTILAESTDLNLTGISFLVDGDILYTDVIAPYEYTLYTNDFDNGEHTVRVQSVRSIGTPTGTNYNVSFLNNFEYTVLGALILTIIIFMWIRRILLGSNFSRARK